MLVKGYLRDMMMPERHFETADADRAALRAAVAQVDRFITSLPSAHPGSGGGLAASWEALVKLLALGEARQLRDCPRCGRVCISDATRCGHCWLSLTAIAPTADHRQVAGGGADS